MSLLFFLCDQGIAPVEVLLDERVLDLWDAFFHLPAEFFFRPHVRRKSVTALLACLETERNDMKK